MSAPAKVTFDAIPGLELPAHVAGIKPLGENNQGDIDYKVTLVPDQGDARLMWNMTARISIVPK